MKKLLLAVLLLTPCAARANPYMRVIGTKGAPFWKSAGFDIAPRHPAATEGVWNVGVITHSAADGSLCSALDLGSWCVPESWVPLQATVGGSFNGELDGGLGTSINVAPQLGALLLAKVDGSSAGWLQTVKASMLSQDPSQTAQFRLGVDFTGGLAQQGHLVSLKTAFPGHGLPDILGNAAKLNVALAW